MSYDIKAVDPVTGNTIELREPHHFRGGTYALGGEPYAALNITFNYAPHFRKVFGDANVQLSDFDRVFGGGNTGIRRLYGMRVSASLTVLAAALNGLGNDAAEDYWAPTEGNAKQALLDLLAIGIRVISEGHYDAVWQGD